MSRTAALLTSFNRRATTLASLDRLLEQHCDTELTIFLADDNSPDGTAAAVSARFPQVRLLHGDGSLFWCGGMRAAFAAALREDFDFYLWLNDDTVLDGDALDRLFGTYRAAGAEKTIVAGSTRDANTGELTYGGAVRSSRFHPLKFRLLEPADHPLRCDTVNGNVVLIPRAVAAVTGNLRQFRHAMADYDYGLRARAAGCSIYLAPGTVGTCSRNADSGTFRDARLPLGRRWQQLMSDKGLPPGDYLRYARRHAGPLWPLYWAMPYFRIVLDSVLRRG